MKQFFQQFGVVCKAVVSASHIAVTTETQRKSVFRGLEDVVWQGV